MECQKNSLNCKYSPNYLTRTWALGEFGATVMFAGNLEGKTQTRPLAIYLGFERGLGVASQCP